MKILTWLHFHTDVVEWQCPKGCEDALQSLRKIGCLSADQSLIVEMNGDKVILSVAPPLFKRSNGTAFRGKFEGDDRSCVLRGSFSASTYQRMFGILFASVLFINVLAGLFMLVAQWSQLTAKNPLSHILAGVGLFFSVASFLFAIIRWQLRPDKDCVDKVTGGISDALASRLASKV